MNNFINNLTVRTLSTMSDDQLYNFVMDLSPNDALLMLTLMKEYKNWMKENNRENRNDSHIIKMELINQ